LLLVPGATSPGNKKTLLSQTESLMGKEIKYISSLRSAELVQMHPVHADAHLERTEQSAAQASQF